MMTLNNWKETFDNFASAHLQIKSNGFGDLTEIEGIDKSLYPRMWVFPRTTTTNNDTQIRSFTILIMDLVHKDLVDQNEVWSDTEQIGTDIIRILKKESDEYTLLNEPVLTIFKENLGDDVSGVTFDCDIETPYDINYCAIPVDPITSVYIDPSNGTYHPAGSFNCDDLNDCSVILGLSQSIANINATFSNYLPLSGGTMSGLIEYTGTAFGTYSLVNKDYVDSISATPSNLTAVLGVGNTTGNQFMTSDLGYSSLGLRDIRTTLSWANNYAGSVVINDSSNRLFHDLLIDIESQNVNVIAATAISLNALGVKVTSTDNASLQIISPTGFYYPSLGFWNTGTNFLGAITGYGGSLYISGAGASITPLIVNTVVQLPYLTAGNMLYIDSFNSIREVMIGTGLTFSGATLSTTSTIPVINAITPLVYSGGTFSILQSGSTQSGYLDSTDWNTFNDKFNAASASLYVPYTGATGSVDLNSQNFTVTGNITTGMSGSAERVVQASSGGVLTATKDIIDGFLLSSAAPAILLAATANWSGGNYIGTGTSSITATYQGQQFYNNSYCFLAVNDNDWIRLARV